MLNIDSNRTTLIRKYLRSSSSNSILFPPPLFSPIPPFSLLPIPIPLLCGLYIRSCWPSAPVKDNDLFEESIYPPRGQLWLLLLLVPPSSGVFSLDYIRFNATLTDERSLSKSRIVSVSWIPCYETSIMHARKFGLQDFPLRGTNWLLSCTRWWMRLLLQWCIAWLMSDFLRL